MAASAYGSPWRLNWLKAVHKGDCLEIEDLLKKDEGLVTIYPRSESCKDASDFAAQFAGWRGCSALHVAVKRGWPFLVQMIVNLFREESQPSGNSADHTTPAAENSNVGEERRNQNDRRRCDLTLTMLEELLLAFDSDYHLDALALAVVNGNATIVRILAKASIRCANNPYRARLPFPNAMEHCLNPTGSRNRRKAGQISTDMGEEDTIDRSATGFESAQEPGLSIRSRDLEARERTLWEITEEAFGKLRDTNLKAEKQRYLENPAYNFLPMRLFFTHHWIVERSSYYKRLSNTQGFLTRKHPRRSKSAITGYVEKVMQILRARVDGEMLMDFLFSLKDGRGKTLAHVLAAVYPSDHDWDCISQWGKDERNLFLHVVDGAGRTVAHEFVAGLMGRPTTTENNMFYFFLQTIDREELTKQSRRFDGGLFEYFDLDALCTRNGYDDHIYDFQSIFEVNPLYEPSSPRVRTRDPNVDEGNVLHESSALHYAALHNCSAFFSTVIGTCRIPPRWNERCRMRLKRTEKRKLGHAFEKYFDEFASVNILQVAALSGSDSVFKALLEVEDVFDGTRRNVTRTVNQDDIRGVNGPFSVLFIAASAGDPAMIQALLASKKFDPLITTEESKDTALHFAADANYSGPLLQPTLLDLVNVSHRPGMGMPHSFRFSNKKREEYTQAQDSRRKGCISLLLQAGIDIWQKNAQMKTADPGENASPDFCAWWYEKLSKETQDLRAGLNTAANAISVTAALVATASFVGPLQPPQGYVDPQGVINVHDFSVRIFIVCDTLALYFALIAILFSLMPLLPLPQESMLEDLSHVRKVVTFAIAFLIFSVVLFLVGFAAASIAVIGNSLSLTLTSVAIGGSFSLYLMYFFLLRLVRLIFHKRTWIRRNYRGLTLVL